MILFLKCIFISILSIGLAIKFIPLDKMWVSIFWIFFYFVMGFTIKYMIDKSKTPDSNGLLMSTVIILPIIEITFTIIPNFFFP